MEEFLNIIANLGMLSLVIPILSILLTWLFIRSAVASGTKQGIIDAYNTLSGKSQQKAIDDYEAEMKGWE